MPAIQTQNADGDIVWRFDLAKVDAACSPTESGIRYLLKARLDSLKLREELAAIARKIGSDGDREGARMLSDLAKEQMRLYRAACLCLPWFKAHDLPGDCPVVPPSEWLVELARELDFLYASANIAESDWVK